MAFFGLTALGPQNSFASSSVQRRNLQIFEESDFQHAWEAVNGKGTTNCRITAINDIMRNLFRGPIPANDKYYIDQKFQDISLATGLLTISFENYMTAMQELRNDAFQEEEALKGKPKPTCEFTSSVAFKESMVRHSRMRKDATSKLSVPLTSSQEFGWHRTELQIPRAGKKTNEITKYADELIKSGVYY